MKIFNWQDILTFDYRSIKLFRVLLGICILVDLIWKISNTQAFFSDEGIMPRSELIGKFMHPDFWSFHLISGTEGFQIFLMLIHFLLALCFIKGIGGRLLTLLLFIFTVSLQNRNMMILNGGDDLIRILLFWSIFIPLNKNNHIRSWATLAIILQTFWIYYTSAILKTGQEWTTEYSALYYALSLDQFSTEVGKFLLNYPELLKTLTKGTLFIEGVLIFLLFLPGPVAIWRSLLVLCFFGLHLGIFLTMGIGVFPWVCIALWCLFIPTKFWDFFKKEEVKTITFNNFYLLFFILIIGWWNLATIQKVSSVTDSVRSIMYSLRIDQSWGMFAPRPLREDGWYIISGKNLNKQEIVLFPNNFSKEKALSKPSNVSNTYSNEPWRKYYMNLYLPNNSMHLPLLAEYFCKKYNKQHQDMEQLAEISIIFMKEVSMLVKKYEKIEPISLLNHNCKDTNEDGTIFKQLEKLNEN